MRTLLTLTLLLTASMPVQAHDLDSQKAELFKLHMDQMNKLMTLQAITGDSPLCSDAQITIQTEDQFRSDMRDAYEQLAIENTDAHSFEALYQPYHGLAQQPSEAVQQEFSHTVDFYEDIMPTDDSHCFAVWQDFNNQQLIRLRMFNEIVRILTD